MRVATVAVLISTMLSAEAGAQYASTLVSGHRVRLTAPSLELWRHEAVFRRFSGGTLVSDSASYPISAVTRLDVYAGRGSRWAAGAAIGGVFAGMIGGAAFGAFCKGFRANSKYDCAGTTMAGVGIGVSGGVLVGMVIGAFIGYDRWAEVPLSRLQLTARSGLGDNELLARVPR